VCSSDLLDNHQTAIFGTPGNEPTRFSLTLGVRLVSIATTANKSRVATNVREFWT
jgi:hypothetical protein